MAPLGDGYYLQVAAEGWKGRKWYVSPHVSDSELIQVALLACLAHAEHEIRERFRYSPYPGEIPRAIYGPHFHADALWGVAGDEENYDFRRAGEFRMGDKGTGVWPEVGWKWRKWTFGVWTDPSNRTRFGIDFGPLEVVWRMPGYRP